MLFDPLIKLNRFLYLCNVRIHLFLCEWSESVLGLDYRKSRRTKLPRDFVDRLRAAVAEDPKKQLMKKIIKESEAQIQSDFQVRILELD